MSVFGKHLIVRESCIGRLLTKLQFDHIFKFLESPENINEVLNELVNIIEVSQPLEHPDVYHSGGWLAVPLRIARNSLDGIQSRDGEFEWNKKYHIPKTITFIESLCKNCKRVRLLGLTPNQKVYWHVDRDEGFDSDTLRLHLVIKTNDKASMSMCQYTLSVHSGTLFVADFSFPHYLQNNGKDTRWHLVFDCPKKDLCINNIFNILENGINDRKHAKKIIYFLYYPYNILFTFKRYFRIIKNKLKIKNENI